VTAALLAFLLAACHKEEQAIKGVAKKAESEEKKVQANETELEKERAELEQIPLPTKSLYIDIHDPAALGKNPFLSVVPTPFHSASCCRTPIPVRQGREACFAPRPPAPATRPAASDLDEAVAAIPAGACTTAA